MSARPRSIPSTSAARAARPGCCASSTTPACSTPADVHVALRLAALAGEDDEQVALAAALAVRAPAARPRLRRPRDDPRHRDRRRRRARRPLGAAVAAGRRRGSSGSQASALVAVGEEDAARAGRCAWSAPRSTSTATGARSARSPPTCGRSAPRRPTTSTTTCSPTGSPGCSPARPTSASAWPRASAVLRRFAVVAGGPGTGKTTTVARIVALLAEQAAAAGAPAPLVALAAPTGKAAARLEEAVHDEAAEARRRATPSARSCSRCSASTLHRLLGWRPDSHSRFRHHRGNRLPHDVVIVDETSMVSLSLMARLVEAVRPEARLVLVGDPGQLDLDRGGRRARRHRRAGATTDARSGIVVLEPRPPLRRRHRRARRRPIRRGDADAVDRRARRRARRRDLDPRRRREPDAGALAPGPRRRRRRRPRRDRRRPRRRRAARRSRRSAPSASSARTAAGPYGVADVDRPDRGLARRRGRGLRRRGPLVRRPPAARDRERLRPAPLQRRHRRRRRRPTPVA